MRVPVYPSELAGMMSEWVRGGIPGGFEAGVEGFTGGYVEDLSLNGLARFLAGLWRGRPAVAVALNPSCLSSLVSAPGRALACEWSRLARRMWRLARKWGSIVGSGHLEYVESGGSFYAIALPEDPGAAGELLVSAREVLASLTSPHDIYDIVYGDTKLSRDEVITILFQVANSLAFDVFYRLENFDPNLGLSGVGYVSLDEFEEVVSEAHEVSRSTLYRILNALKDAGYLVHHKGVGYVLNLRSGAGYVAFQKFALDTVEDESLICALKPYMLGYTHKQWLLNLNGCSEVVEKLREAKPPEWFQGEDACQEA